MWKPGLTAIVMLAAGVAMPVNAHPEHGAMLERADTNNDGMIVREEYVAARAALFAKLDQNSDGFLDKADRPEGADAARHPRMKDRHARLDADGDGKVSKEEFAQGGASMFERFDTDHNSVIDAKEIEAAREKVAKRRQRPLPESQD